MLMMIALNSATCSQADHALRLPVWHPGPAAGSVPARGPGHAGQTARPSPCKPGTLELLLAGTTMATVLIRIRHC
eukprot:87990-Rhodomonas_salina.1